MPHPTLGTTLFNLAGVTHHLRSKSEPLRPTTPTAFFIEKGHVMEILDAGRHSRRIVALFFGPGEFAIPCHPLSELVSLDEVKGNTFTHGVIFQTLRKFSESHIHYREMRKLYHEKVAARIHCLQTMTDVQRYNNMVASQPWILKLAKPEDIASYLRISVDLLRELRK
ncbi:MAG: hypothetical protein J0H74_34880 [Chitinophagaceae bacterium]|nr:hypothetical protein [Chitinophagaceae bacterium]